MQFDIFEKGCPFKKGGRYSIIGFSLRISECIDSETCGFS